MTVPVERPIPIDIKISDLIDDERNPIQLLEEDPIDTDGTTVFEQPITDSLIHAKLTLPQGENMSNAKVKSRSIDFNGEFVDIYNPNPLLNLILYDAEFEDGVIKQHSANIIAQTMQPYR